jgi:succinyl-diaminopimelate desuccinylase
MPLQAKERAFLDDLLRLKTSHEPENRAEHDRCRELVAAQAEAYGLKTHLVKNDPFPSLLVGKHPEDKAPAVMLAAHLDVVPAAPEMYEPRVEEGKLYARGASDMKFCAPLFFKAIEDLPEALKERVLICFTFDEEIGGNAGTRFLLDTYGLRPKTCFLPDGGDNFLIEADEKGVLQFRIKTAGKSAHGSRPWLGENAIDRFLAIYADLRAAFPAIDQPGLWGPTLNLGKLTGGAAANQVPDACEALLDTRFTESTTLKAVYAEIERIVAGRGEVSPVVQGDLFHLDQSSPACAWLQEGAQQHLGKPLGIYRSEGASDARFFTQYGIPVVITKPICAGHHSTSEWVDLASLDPYYGILLHFTRAAAAAR